MRYARWLTCALALLAITASHAGKLRQVDTTPPQFSKIPEAASVSETSFMLRLALNEAGMTYFSILPAGSLPPSAMEVLQGTANNTITVGTINAPAAHAVVSAGIEDLPASKHRALDIYLVAEDVYGNLVNVPHHLSVDLADFTEPSFPRGFPRLVSLGTEFANVDLGLDEPGFVYYLLQRATPARESDAIDPVVIKACALHNTSCPVDAFASAGRLAIGEPAVGQHLAYDGDNLFASYKLPYKPGNYWVHFAAEDDEATPNLMRKRNVVRRRLATVQPPTWSDKGPDPFYVPSLVDESDPVKGYTVYEDPGITANNPDSKIDITDDVIMTHNVDTSMPGVYTVNFQVTYPDSSNQLVTGYETRTVIVTGPWAPAYKGSMNGINNAEGNNPGSCCEWYRTCRLEDYLWDCTQDVIDACKPTDTNAKCIICLQLDKHVRAGFGYQKYTHTKPDVSVLGQDAAFIGRIRLEEMERQKAMGNLPGLMGPKHPGYFSDPVHHLEKSTKANQRSETAKVLENGHNWKKRLSDDRLDLLAHHNVRHRRLLANYNGYEFPSNVRHRNDPHRINLLKGDLGDHGMRFPKFSVCRAVRYQCTAFQDAGSGKCLPVDGALRPWDYEMNHATFAKNEVRKDPLQKYLDEKVRNSEPVWQR